MFFALLSLFWKAVPTRRAMAAMLWMTALELFQLTNIPLHMLSSRNLVMRIVARLLGTEFRFLDLLAYAIGIAAIYAISLRVFPSGRNLHKCGGTSRDQ